MSLAVGERDGDEMVDADIQEFIRYGLAAICALAWVAYQHDTVRILIENKRDK
jgi:hypothetical protein